LNLYKSPEYLTKPTDYLTDAELKTGDVWGLGVIVHELLSKTMPFDLRIPSETESTANMTA